MSPSLSFQTSGKILTQKTRRQDKPVFARLGEFGLITGFLVPELIFMFHGHTSSEARLQQDSNKLRPIDQPLSRDAITPPTLSVDSHFGQNRLDNLSILGVHPENA